MSDWIELKSIKIADEMYDELYDRIIGEEIEEMDEYDVDDFEDFMFYNGNHENSLGLLSEGEGYYIDGVMKEWDKIIKLLYQAEHLEDIKPQEMTKRKITNILLYRVCVDVIGDYVEELNNKKNEEKEKEEKRVNKYNDFKDEVDENDYYCGMIDGKTLKDMCMSKYFNKYKIDEEECYEITFYKAKEEKKDLPCAFSDCYLKIEDLSDKIHYIPYNTSSAFAYELGNISYNEEEEE